MNEWALCCHYLLWKILSSHSGAAGNSVLVGCNTRWQVVHDVGFSIPFQQSSSPSCSFKHPPILIMVPHTICLLVINMNNQRRATQYHALEASCTSTLETASPSTCKGYLHSVNSMPIWKYVPIYALYAKRPQVSYLGPEQCTTITCGTL
jgi:hypothetical protein